MNLDSIQNITLLKNCIVVKIQQLNLQIQESKEHSPKEQKTLESYKQFLELLKNSDGSSIQELLNHPVYSEDLAEFSKHILSTPAASIAEEYIDYTKQMLMEHNVYSEDKFQELVTAFYKGNETLNPDYQIQEEPEDSVHLTETMKASLEKLHRLVKQNPKTMTPEQFQDLSGQFRDITKSLGINKFQQHFSEQGQTITNMEISKDVNDAYSPVYRIDFTLLDSNSKESHFSLQEPASQSGFIANYYQNLCYTYLESDKCSKMNKVLLTPPTILNKMKTFKECYSKLDAMMSNCKITISPNNTIIYSSESEIEPSKLNDYITDISNHSDYDDYEY